MTDELRAETIRVAENAQQYRRVLERMVADARSRPPDPTLAVAVSVDMLALLLGDLAAAERATPEPAPDVEALRVAAQAVIGDPADWPPDDEWDEAFLALRAALHPADPSQTPEVETWLAIRAALHEAANDKCRDGRFDHCYDQFHSPPIRFADWWPPADPSRREP